MRMSLTVTLILTLVTVTGAVADFTVLDGDTQAVIVRERLARGEALSACQDLASYLKTSTGRDFAVVDEDDYEPAQGPPIYVGMCAPVKAALGLERYGMDRDAFAVIVTDDAAMLAGPSPWATYWAVCQFLEDYVGVRWLIPGPLGEDVPAHETITVPEVRQIHTPAILSRLWSGAHYGGVWSLRQRIHGRYAFHHNLLNIFPPELFDEHPEYFPMHGDERYRPGPDDHSWQPCMTDPGGIQHAADVARAAFAANPDLESFSFGINDGHGYCECPNCKLVDHPLPEWHGFSGDKSILYYTWLNRIAENLEQDHPDKMLGCLAYSAVILPPTGMRLHRNIIPYLTSNRSDYWDPVFKRQDETMLERWAAVTNQMGIYEYGYGMGFAIPRIYNHLFQEAIQHAVAHKVRGFYAEVYPNWGLDGPKLYVMARLLWDPYADVDAITDDWNERMFRTAAAPMKRYFALAEQAWRENNFGHGHWAYRLAADPQQFRIFPPDLVDEMMGLLDEATALAQDDIVRDRIQFFRKTFEITKLLAGNYWASYGIEEMIEQGASMEDIAAAMRRMVEQVGETDIDAYMAERVGDDPIAFHPPKPGWINPLKAGGQTVAKRWIASRLITEELEAAAAAGAIDAAALRERISARVDEVFGEGGSAGYRTIVEQVRAMATRVGTAARAEQAPTIDGRLDEPVWGRADVLTDFIKWGMATDADHVTRARVVHDGDDLYIALECEQDTSDLVTNAAPRDGSTWHDDSVEIFMNPRVGEYEYVQLIINAAGAFFDQWRRSEEMEYSEALAYDLDADWAATVQEGMWTAEIRVPLGEFGFDARSGALLPINFVRNVQGADAEISSWFPSIRAHADPVSRGWIVME